nr:zinc finger, CCHC-type, retrotransposon Gag domain protein [Tanacetum cinerariifolium]
NAGGNPPQVTIHTWLERVNKQKPNSFEKATVPVDAENYISHMEKIFDVMGCEYAFKTRLAVYKFEGRGVVIGTSRPLSRVVTGTTVIITTVMGQTGEVVVTTIASTTTTLATTS